MRGGRALSLHRQDKEDRHLTAGRSQDLQAGRTRDPRLAQRQEAAEELHQLLHLLLESI